MLAVVTTTDCNPYKFLLRYPSCAEASPLSRATLVHSDAPLVAQFLLRFPRDTSPASCLALVAADIILADVTSRANTRKERSLR